ncbi:MAG: iron-containing alcohol dehydrogenase [Treponema sp.]|nr:iron-containing alcohol dehydrogenase [Treponema sp.]
MIDIVLKIDPEIVMGMDIINRVGTICKTYGNQFLLISEKRLNDDKSIERLKAILQDSGVQTILFDEIKAPVMADIAENIAHLARAAHCSGIIGFGSPSVQAIARLSAIIAADMSDVFEFLDGKIPTTGLPYIAIPSVKEDPFLTAESFIVEDPRDREIRLIHTPRGLCKAVVIDGAFSGIMSVDGGYTPVYAAAFDGFCMAVEAYCSKKANILSDAVLEKAIALFAQIISSSVNGGVNMKELDVQAALLVNIGSAVSAPGVGSTLARAIADRFPVEKSLCSAALLPAILDKLVSCRAEKIAAVALLMGEKTEGLPDAEAALLPAASIRSSLEKLAISPRLRDLGLQLDRLIPITESARNLDIVAFSPWTVTTEEILNIIKQSF